ncbi:Ferric iron ABC transporter, iron-binding protein [Salinispira pacifica]|uniref:Ferric iron ABC transporter, iron-binding protein n=1 Tax=Salinispira pacifica TaxID=1307761 RepID=V5WDD9_9SPIO|nr:Ferric iron ABC transporter, iron-binding protein [Salinispira pacifica]
MRPLRQRVWTELESGEIRADVFWGSDPLVYNALEARGALSPFQPEAVASFRPEFQVDHDYTLVSERYGVIIYNSDALHVENVPTSFADLADPSLRERIVHADPTQSATALALVAGLYEISGNDWTLETRLRDNGLFLARRNGDVPMKIQEGEFDAGIAPHDPITRLRKKAQKEGYPLPLAIAWPSEGAIAIQRPIAISRNPARPAENQQIAEAFVRFLVSRKAQNMMANFGFVSVRSDVPVPSIVPEDVVVSRLDWETLTDRQEMIADEFAALFH